MANEIYDGHTIQRGSDASVDTSEVARIYNHISVNRKYRGGLNQTRDPFVDLPLDGDTEDVEAFQNAAIRGAIGYRYEAGLAQPHMLVKGSDSIFRVRLEGSQLNVRKVWDGLNPDLKRCWFQQAEDLIFYQDTESNPLFWNGFRMEEVKSGMVGFGTNDTFVDVMPKGDVMLYAHGRMWVASGNIVYASNHLYGSGVGAGASRNLCNFSEQTYPASGGGFGSPSQLGDLVGMSVVPRHPEVNGHGEIIIWHSEGAYAILPTRERNQWTDLDIQQIVLVGRGAASSSCIVPVNNDIWYRSTDKSVASFKHSLLNQRSSWGDNSLSREVQRYLDKDDRSRLKYSIGIKTKNRLLITTNHSVEDSADGNQFILSNGMVSLDFDAGSTVTPDSEFAWDGLWTGLRVTAAAEVHSDSAPRYFFVDAGKDGVNRIFELLEDSKSNDFVNGKEVGIQSFYTQERLFSQLNPREELIYKQLRGSYIRYRDAIGRVELSQYFRNSDYGCWFDLVIDRLLSDVPLNKSECYEDYINGKKPINGYMYSDLPRTDLFEQGSDRSATEDESFDALTKLVGVVTITRNQLIATPKKKEPRYTDKCENDFSEAVRCCKNSDLEYSYNISDYV